jgi:low temperature requirement protein LtrA
VVAVTRVSALLDHDHGWSAALRALVVFVPIYWTWVGASVQANLRDMARLSSRLLLFAVALAGIFMALPLDDAYGEHGLVFAIAYWAGRIVLGIGPLRRLGFPAGVAQPLGVGKFLTGPLLVVGALVSGDARVTVWALAAAIDLATPSVLRRRMRGRGRAAGVSRAGRCSAWRGGRG